MPEAGVATMDAMSEHSTPLLQNLILDLKKTTLEAYREKPVSHWILLFLSSASMLIIFPASSILSRVYFANGGTSKWIISWVSVAGWPIIAIALISTYIFKKITPTRMNWKLLVSYIFLGFLSTADNLMFAYAYAYLPASTSSLLASSSLAFSAIFGYFIVKNQLNAAMINAFVIITAAMAIIALDSSSDRYGYVSKGQYAMGFMWDILGSALHGLIFALSELFFDKFHGRRSFHVVLEQQFVVSFSAFLFATAGLAATSDGFYGMVRESRVFKGGEAAYDSVLIWSAVSFQLGVLGSTAVLFLASTVMAGVLNAVRVPITSVAAVILLHDPMSGFKILSLVITIWGFCSYIYGGSMTKNNKDASSSP